MATSFAGVCDALLDFVVVTGLDGHIRYANRVISELLGCQAEEMRGRPLRAFLAEEEVLRDVDFDVVLGPAGTRDLNMIFCRPDGESEAVTLSASPVSFEGEAAIVFVGRPAGATQQLLAEATRWAANEKEKADELAAAARELEIAKRLQTCILPRTFEVRGLELAALMQPAAVVGGDYYDVLPVADGCWVTIGDVAGHGLQAGLIMMMMQSVASALIKSRPDAAPSELLTVLNDVLYENVRDRLASDEHATLTLLRLHDDGKLVFSGAHEDIVIWRAADRRCERIATSGPWVGAVRSIAGLAGDDETRLAPGDVLLLHTDGITEAKNVHGELFGIERLCDFVDELGGAAPSEVLAGVFTRVTAWMVSQRDDMTLLLLRRSGRTAAP